MSSNIQYVFYFLQLCSPQIFFIKGFFNKVSSQEHALFSYSSNEWDLSTDLPLGSGVTVSIIWNWYSPIQKIQNLLN